MADSTRVAVYIDFDNVVISRYDHVFGRGAWRQDDARRFGSANESAGPIDLRLKQAEIDVSAIIDYASSFGTVALTRAYADWSLPANAAYRRQLVDRAVDLTQLFTTSGMKNGADIRLSIDAINDLYQYADITHVVVVAGDSDYIALAQRCKQMGRVVVGIGVAESTSRALVRACDVFTDYALIPGVEAPMITAPVAPGDPAPRDKAGGGKAIAGKASAKKATTKKATTKKAAGKTAGITEPTPEDNQATALLLRAVNVGLANSDDEWLYTAGVKSQMQRMDSTFKEKALGFSSFRAFVESRSDVVETEVRDRQLRVRLR